MKFDELRMLESLTSKTLTNWVTFLFAPLKINIIVELSHGHEGWDMYLFSLTTAVCGIHVYKDVWEPTSAGVSDF